MFSDKEIVAKLDAYFGRLSAVLGRLSREDIVRVIRLLTDAYENGKQVVVMGNGGSATTASHMVTDFNKGVSYGRKKRFRMIALTDSIASIMAISNDISYDDVFVEQLKTYMNPGDYVIGISGSGNSKNVINAIDYANEHGGITIGWSGYSGGLLKQSARHNIHVDIEDMQITEDVHLILNHAMMQILCESLGDEDPSADDRRGEASLQR